MNEPTRPVARVSTVVVLTLLSATFFLLLALYVHMKTYGALYPGETMMIDHNATLEAQVTLHFRVGYQLMLATLGWLFWRVSGNLFGLSRDNKTMAPTR